MSVKLTLPVELAGICGGTLILQKRPKKQILGNSTISVIFLTPQLTDCGSLRLFICWTSFFYQQIFKLLACTPCVSVRFVAKGEIFEIEWISGIGWVFDMEGIALVFVWFANIWEIMVLSARSVGVPRVKLNISKKYCNLFWSRCPMYQWVFLYPLSTLYIARIHFSSTCCEICQNYANDNNNM